jgi:hypothetical protein
MNFIRNICNALINLFVSTERQEIPNPLIDISKVYAENFEEIPDLPKEMIPEPFYSTMLSDLVESPLYMPSQLPMPGVPLELPPLACKAMGISIPRSGEDTVL